MGDSALVWIRDYLQQLPSEVDVDVLSDYIAGVLNDLELTEDDMCTEVETLLSAYLPDNLSKTSSEEIVRYAIQHKEAVSVSHQAPNGLASTDRVDMLSVEARMRALMQADYEHQLQAAELKRSEPRPVRDACTTAVLREAGVAGYQGDSEEEKEMEIAITNAEFQAKQRLDLGGGGGKMASNLGCTPDSTHEVTESDLDLEELEHISGYGKKDDVKPGTVEDALSVLNPSLFGTARSIAAQPFPVGVTRLPTPGSRPMGFQLSAITVPTGSAHIHPGPDKVGDGASRGLAEQKKKKAPAPSKHIAKVGAQAEAKQKAKSKCGVTRGPTAARQDEMDAFLFSDSDSDAKEGAVAPLPEGGHNRERMVAAEQANRQASSSAHQQRRQEEKASRAKQLDEAAQRKQAAQRKAQKVERRR